MTDHCARWLRRKEAIRRTRNRASSAVVANPVARSPKQPYVKPPRGPLKKQLRPLGGPLTELVDAIIQDPEFEAAVGRSGRATRAEGIIAHGVEKELQEFRDGNYQRTITGRIAYNAILDAAIACLKEQCHCGDLQVSTSFSMYVELYSGLLCRRLQRSSV